MPIRAVIFDLDGTLLNCPYDFAAMRKAVVALAEKYGLLATHITHLGILEGVAEAEKLLGEEAGKRFCRGDTARGFLAG